MTNPNTNSNGLFDSVIGDIDTNVLHTFDVSSAAKIGFIFFILFVLVPWFFKGIAK